MQAAAESGIYNYTECYRIGCWKTYAIPAMENMNAEWRNMRVSLVVYCQLHLMMYGENLWIRDPLGEKNTPHPDGWT